MKTQRKLILPLALAATVFLGSALTATAGPRPEIAREIHNLDRATDSLINDVKRALHYRGERKVTRHSLYRDAKNLDNNVERLEDDFHDREGARRLIRQLDEINRDLYRFERSAQHCRVWRAVSRSLQWTRGSVSRLNAFADAFIARRGHGDRRDHHCRHGHGDDCRACNARDHRNPRDYRYGRGHYDHDYRRGRDYHPRYRRGYDPRRDQYYRDHDRDRNRGRNRRGVRFYFGI
jgi:hypothetical protein